MRDPHHRSWPEHLQSVALWSTSAFLVLGLHSALAYLVHDVTLEPPVPEPEQLVMVELEPLPVDNVVEAASPPSAEPEPAAAAAASEDPKVEEKAEQAPQEADQQDTPEEPEEPDPAEPKEEETADTPPEPEPEPVIDEERRRIASLQATPAPVEPPLPPAPQDAPAAEADLPPPPQQRAQPVRNVKADMPQQPAAKPVVQQKVKKKKAPHVARVAPTAKPRLQPSATSKTRWNNAVRAAIAARVGGLRGKGSVRLSFAVSASGRVLSARLVSSSGDGRLDSAVLRQVRGARVPAPPPGTVGASHVFSIPIRFN